MNLPAGEEKKKSLTGTPASAKARVRNWWSGVVKEGSGEKRGCRGSLGPHRERFFTSELQASCLSLRGN